MRAVLKMRVVKIIWYIPKFTEEKRNTPLMLAKPLDEEDKNIFDNLPSLAKPQTSHLCDELTFYLLAPIEEAEDPILWWSEHHAIYP